MPRPYARLSTAAQPARAGGVLDGTVTSAWTLRRPPRTGFAYLDDPGTVLPFAHRGGAFHPDLEGLENTLTAFRHADALGFRYLETDVQTTSDGVLLAFHDAVLDRVTDQVGRVADTTYAQVRRARVGGHEHVPTLAELFEACPQARFNLDLKTDAAAPLLADFVDERAAHDRVLVGSFGQRRLDHFRRLTRGRVATSATVAEAAAFYALPARVADLATLGQVSALQIPYHRGPLTVATERFVRRMHAVCKHVHVWVVDDETEMHRLLDRGVDGLMTDRTDILKAVLQERGQWREP